MATDDRLHSDLPIPPGDYLAEVLRERHFSQIELARRIGRPAQAINEIIKGQKSITPATAIQLERALGVPAHIWTGLENRFQLIKARQDEERSLDKDIPLLKEIPYKELEALGRVRETRDRRERVRETHVFYGVSSLANLPNVEAYSAYFRCGKGRHASPYSLAAWLKCAEDLAARTEVEAFNKGRLRRSLGAIRSLTTKAPETFAPELERLLASCGVVLVLQPHFTGTYAQGAVFWLGRDKAVLALSIRGRWADIVWFSLFHELGHILLHKRGTYIDDGGISPGSVRAEEEADRFAANTLIGAARLLELVRGGDLGEKALRAFAKEQGIDVGIVIGRLQHEGRLPNNTELNRLRTRIEWESSSPIPRR